MNMLTRMNAACKVSLRRVSRYLWSLVYPKPTFGEWLEKKTGNRHAHNEQERLLYSLDALDEQDCF